MRRLLFRAIATLALLLGAAAAHAADTLDAVRARGELTWGGDIQGGEPYVYRSPENPDALTGFEVDIADAIGRRLGVRARFVQADWSTLIPTLERGDFDVAMNGIEDTPERRERVLLSAPYFVFGETLAVRKGSALRSLAALRGQRVATLNQSYAELLLGREGFAPVLYEGVSEPYTDLGLGRVDAVLLDHIIAARYGCSLANVECLPDDVARGDYVIATRRTDSRLAAAVNAALDGLKKDGELRKILEHWKLWDGRQTAPLPPPDPSVGGTARSWTWADTWLFLGGALVTLGLSVSAFALALPLGLGLALCRLGRSGAPRVAATVYVEVFRGTPLLLQLYVLYFGLAPIVRLSAIAAAILGLALNYAAYEAEIHRGALLAVPRGQTEGAHAVGLTRWQTLRHVTLPQSFRIALPAMTNDFVALLKDSSLVSVITVVELTKRMSITAIDLRGWLVPGLACAALYFAMSYPLARLAGRLERNLHRDQHPEPA